MKEYSTEKGFDSEYCVCSISIVEASRTTIVGNADLNRGPVRTSSVLATCVYFSRAVCQARYLSLTVLALA
jgi:hypothetical protein